MKKMGLVAAAATAAAALAGCGGGGTKTVTVGSAATSSDTITIPNDPSCQNGKDTVNGAPCTPAPASDTSTTDTAGANTSSTTDSSAGGAIPSVPVGTSQSLSATQENENIDVTVTAVPRLTSTDQVNTPDAGKHYVGVYVKYHNTGSQTFNDSPGNEVKLIDNHANEISSDISNIADCTNDGSMNVGASETLRSCVVFQVPDNRQVKTVQISLDSGNDTPGEWTLH